MKKNVIVFGTSQTAQLANYYLTQTTDEYNVVAFAVHSKFKTCDTFCDKQVVEFDNIETLYNPNDYYLFAPMMGTGLNKIREKIYNEGKQKGYTFITYISKYATVLSNDIGENCFILEDNTIQPFVKIGNNCVIWSGNHIGHHSVLGDHLFITSHVVISGNCTIEKYCWFGVNATIRNALLIKEGSLISMGACLTKNTDEYTMYVGVPAKPFGRSDDEKICNNL